MLNLVVHCWKPLDFLLSLVYQHGFWQCYRLCHRTPYCPGYILEPLTTVECLHAHLNDTHSFKKKTGRGTLYTLNLTTIPTHNNV